IRSKTPQFFARKRVVTTYGFRAVGDQFSPRLALINRGRAPRRNLLTRRFPDKLAVLQAVGSDKGIFLNVCLDDYQVAINNRRTAVFPLVVSIVEPTGIEHSNILLPKQLAI